MVEDERMPGGGKSSQNSDVAEQLSDSLKTFVGQLRKILNKNNRVLFCLNTGLFIFSKHCKFDGKYTGNIHCRQLLIGLFTFLR